jgi:excinuclease ABC subunit A
MADVLSVKGARQHNLKNINLDIPKNKLVVFTGLSGSGKSSLAFDTIYAEGQRRYVESLSSYARQFLGLMGKPDVDQIDGLSPAIAIDQKTTSSNPRSTVGTITEIYDYLRLLYARVGRPHCPKCGQEIERQSLGQITDQALEVILSEAKNSSQPVRFMLLSPVVRDRKGEFSDLLVSLRQQGFARARLDGKIHSLNEEILLIKTNRHTIETVVERITFSKKQAKDDKEIKTLKSRLSQSLETALKLSSGLAILTQVKDAGLSFPENPKEFKDHLFSENFACPDCNISLSEVEPRIFSFNSPHGACPKCSGLGTLLKIDPDKLLAPSLTLFEGAVIPLANQLSTDSWMARTIKTLFDSENVAPKLPWQELPKEIQQKLLFGSSKSYRVSGSNREGREASFTTKWEGFIPHLKRRHSQTESDFIRQEIQKYMSQEVCPNCQGARLKPESLAVTLDKLNISQLTELSIRDINDFLSSLAGTKTPLNSKEQTIGKLIFKEVLTRLNFLLAVGLDYLSLARPAGTLAGGEAQRIRLASQIGTGLTGVLYVLDEPSIGLHQRDNQRLITTLQNLRDLGNTIIVVEHDAEIMLNADHLVDFGPRAGKHGGEVVAAGTPKQVIANSKSLTGLYLKGKKKVTLVKSDQTKEKSKRQLTITGATEHNLKNITVDFPLNQLVVVSGVSGSGKSTLIHDTLFPALRNKLGYQTTKAQDKYRELKGAEAVDKVTLIDQSPIGRTPRSNPATYTKAFDYIRQLYANTRESKVRGYAPGRFSFNVKGGRCESCQGEGQVKIEMQFMADVYITCEVCNGSRYQEQTLEIKYNNKNIAEVLKMTVDEALDFFPHVSSLHQRLATLKQVGLGYLELGQPAPTLSGGEAQRIKLAKELSVKSQGHTMYLLDEPTTGLHFEDITKLLHVLKQLVLNNNTVVVIEHNLDVIKNADWVIDLGPEGGDLGGKVVATATPKDLSKLKISHTGQFLKKVYA